VAKIVFLGDLRVEDGEIVCNKTLTEICGNAGLVVANLEGPVIKAAKPRADKRGVCLANSPTIIELLKKLNVKLLLLGNNHILDYGESGLTETIQFCKINSINYVGVRSSDNDGNYKYFDDCLGISIYSFSHKEGPTVEADTKTGVGPYTLPDTDQFSKEIEKERQLRKSVFVVYHGGEEYFDYPWPRRLGWFKRVSDSGANIVIGNHSHSIQPAYETSIGRFMVLGMGNTYFDNLRQKYNKNGQNGTIIEYDTETNKMVLHELYSDIDNKRLFVTGTRNLNAYDLGIDEVVSGWHKQSLLCMSGNLNCLFSSKRPEWYKFLVRIYKICQFLKRIVLRTKKRPRDKDIFLSSFPLVGTFWARKIINRGYKHFVN